MAVDVAGAKEFLAAQLGIMCTVFNGIIATVQVVLAQMLKKAELPYFFFMAGASLLLVATFACAGACRAKLSHRQMFWMVLRSFVGLAAFLLGILAARTGAQPGDIAALTSINVVSAAVCGRLFLQEDLRPLHMVAIGGSMAGAVLIARPEFIFGASQAATAGSPPSGIALALASGGALSLYYICARKSAGIPTITLACCTAGISLLAFALLPSLGLAQDSLEDLAALPWWHLAGFTAFLAVVTMLDITLGSVGAVLCPAAVSATVNTCSAMGSGYLAQIIQGAAPQPLTVLGAALMLLAVVIMAATRVTPKAAEQAGTTPPVEVPEAPATQLPADERPANDDVLSNRCASFLDEGLACFVASEYAVLSLSPPASTARQRRPVSEPPAQSIGSVVAPPVSE